MKNALMVSAGILLATLGMSAHADETESIEAVVKKFADFDNTYNVAGLESVTDQTFHFVMFAKGNLNNSADKVDVISRATFLAGVKDQKFGGSNKQLEIKRIDVQGNIANVYFTHKGKAFGFHHFINLVKLNNQWKIVSAASHMEFYK